MTIDVPRHVDLIFDIGAHTGEDTSFYLKKGFRVVAVEANPDLCVQLRERFSTALSSGQLLLIEAAISELSGVGTFYKFGTTVFGTMAAEWAEFAQKMGKPCEEIQVRTIAASDLYRSHGVPYFVKIDIEGSDAHCIEALRQFSKKPFYISIEAESYDFDEFERTLSLLGELGYDGYQLVQQQTVPFRRPPVPPREGLAVDHRFKFSSSSGLFGKDLPDRWASAQTILARYRPIVRRQQLYGNRGLGRSWTIRQILRLLLLYPGWHDLHARLADHSE